MRKEHTTKFGEYTYTAKQMSAMDALSLWPRLLSALGQETLQLFFSLKDGQLEALMGDPELGPKIMMGIFGNCKDGELQVLPEILDKCNVQIQECVVAGESKRNVPVSHHLDELYANPFDMFGPAIWAAALSFQKP